jgi:hypothetical protein
MGLQTRLLLLNIVVLLATSGCTRADESPATPEQATPPQIADIARDYKRFKQMTPDAVFVNPELAMLCRGASLADVEEARKKFGPHAHTAVRIYMNDVAEKSFRDSSTPYPVGSIVVKEKTGQAYRGQGTDRTMKMTSNGIGGMVKRATGFDAEHGDWEYFYFEDIAKIETGKISSCVQCHTGAAAKDHVFGSWSHL